jgi:hypothetical protein
LRSIGWSTTMVLAMTICQAGCATVPPMAELEAAGTGFSYSAGRGIQSFQAPPAVVLGVLNEAMGDLELKTIQFKRDGSVSRVESRTSDNRPVVATLRSHRGETYVTVRVGWFGDEPLSRAVLERAAIRLGSQPPEAIPARAPSAPSRNPFFSRDAIPDAEMLRDFAEAPYRDRVIP